MFFNVLHNVPYEVNFSSAVLNFASKMVGSNDIEAPKALDVQLRGFAH